MLQVAARGSRDHGYAPSRNFDNGVGFRIEGEPLSGTTIDLWFLNFAAPFDEVLVPGVYNEFQRWPFQDNDRPGLEFGSTGRLDNRASGFFEIFEATYDTNGDVLSFAADFTHYGEENEDNWAIVKIRHNVQAIPEPSSFGLAIVGMVTLFGARLFKTCVKKK